VLDAHASPDEDAIYTGKLSGSDKLCFFKLHRIGSAFHLYVERDKKGNSKFEDKYIATGQFFECRPEGAHEALLRNGFKYYSANWAQA
jgi:hypothetical protein